MGIGKRARRRRRLRKIGRGAAMAAGVAVIIWIYYLGATWGPRAPGSDSGEGAQVADPELVEESKRLAREFEEIAAAREPSEEDLDLLRQAISMQKEFNRAQRAVPKHIRRLDELEQRLGYFAGKALFEESLEAEEEADRLVQEGEVGEAVALVQQAFDLQREVNKRYGRSEFRDAPRENRLQQRIASMEAQPLYDRSLELEKKASEAAEAFRWDEARRLLTEARDLQVRVNEEARRSVYYDVGRQQRLATQIDSLQVGEMMSQVQALEEEAQSQEAEGQFERAARLYERAFVLQNQINRDHPQSRFVSTDRVAELDASRQTALSTPRAREFQNAVDRMRGALTEGDFSAVGEHLKNSLRLAGQLYDRFPRSRHLNFDLRFELEYLARVKQDLPDLQERLREGLIEIPTQNGWKMSRTPVSQGLYARVMSSNPSRNLGSDLPVDSVTYSQARDFCRRASWILGQPVQLPEREHFEAALGEWDLTRYASISWHKENSEGRSHPVTEGEPNSHGFLHLIGNLRQWIQDGSEEAPSGWTAGVSYDEDLSGQLFRQTSRTERARTVGFRYVVSESSSL